MSQPNESDAGSSPRGSASVGEAPDDRTQETASDSSSGSAGPSGPAGGDTARAGEQSQSGEHSRTAEQPQTAEQAKSGGQTSNPDIPARLKPSPGVAERASGQSRPPRPAATVTVTSSSPSPSSSASKGASGAAAGSASSAGAAAARRGNPRQARLALTRVDPWSVLKLSLVLSLALFVVGLVAVMVLYFVLEGMGVPEALNEMVADVTADPEAGATTTEVLSLGRVFALSLVVGAVNVVLLTALATLGAFLYNLCADVVGGVDVTLSERE